MKLTLTSLLFLIIHLTFSQEAAQPYGRYFVWNLDSTIVYFKPDTLSEKVVKLGYGTEVTILTELKNEPAKFKVPTKASFDGPYFLNGHWVEIETQSFRGYVFSGEAINFPPHKQISGRSFQRLPDEYESFGWNVKVEEKRIPLKGEEGTYYKVEEKTTFPDGSYSIDIDNEGCFEHENYFEGKDINQIYFILKTVYTTQFNGANGKEFDLPKLTNATNSRLEFEIVVEASQGIYIEIREDGKLYFGSYDCT